MEPKEKTANLFTYYKQRENDFTNGLFAILSLSRHECPNLVPSFLRELKINDEAKIDTFKVLDGKDGTADAILSGGNCCIWFETKITSGALLETQIRQHLEGNDRLPGLSGRCEKLRHLVLLTPDDSESQYITNLIAKCSSTDSLSISHLKWRRVYKVLEDSANASGPGTFSDVVRQFLQHIHSSIFSQDLAGAILKIKFGKETGIYSEHYLDDIEAGRRVHWNTRQECAALDGLGRKMLLYDSEQKAITVEVEIKEVAKDSSEAKFPWANRFAEGKPTVFKPPIPLSSIKLVDGFAEFNRSQTAAWNLTHEQYDRLAGNRQGLA